MRRNFALFLVFLISLSCCSGCRQGADVSEHQELIRAEDPGYPSVETTIGFIQTGKESAWREANTKDYMMTFTEAKGYNLIYVEGSLDQKRQIKAMYDLIAQKVDFIIIDPIVETGWDDVFQLAKDREIPVIVAGRGVSADPSLYECWIGSDFKKEGIKAAQWLDGYLEEEERQDEEINIVILEGSEGASETIGRTEGLHEEIAKHDNWHILTSQCANFTQGEGKDVMEQILKKYEDIDVVICENDNMMFGAMKAMDQAKIKYGVDGDIITISFDALYEAFQRMQEGSLMASVECNPLIGTVTEQVIHSIKSGEKVEPVQYVEESLFSYDDAFIYMKDRKY